ncbi:MAG: adenylate kinase family protein [Methanocellales archaeon]|nr:adenylate kinase family protein [Methanocellales archaeon]
MKIAITGTPGTGKSSVCEILKECYNIIHLNQLIEANKFYTGIDDKRNTLNVDIDALADYVKHMPTKGITIFEGHLAHHLPIDIVIVLRASPYELRRRLDKQGFGEAKTKENVEAEALDVILVEAVEMNDRVYEIDTSERSIEEVAKCVIEIIEGTDKYGPGSLDWSEEAFG